MPSSVHEAPHYFGDRLALGPFDVVRAEQGALEPGREPGRDEVGHGRGDRQHGIGAVAAAEGILQPDRGAGADRGRDRTDRGGERVRGDELFGAHDVRLRDRERGQHEPVDRDHHQRACIQRLTVQSGRELDADSDHRKRPDQVCVGEHPLAPPAIEQYSGERADQRIRQQQHRESRGDVGGVGRPLRVEQHRSGQRGLEHAIAELAGQPRTEQPTEPALTQDRPHMLTAIGHGLKYG